MGFTEYGVSTMLRQFEGTLQVVLVQKIDKQRVTYGPWWKLFPRSVEGYTFNKVIASKPAQFKLVDGRLVNVKKVEFKGTGKRADTVEIRDQDGNTIVSAPLNYYSPLHEGHTYTYAAGDLKVEIHD